MLPKIRSPESDLRLRVERNDSTSTVYTEQKHRLYPNAVTPPRGTNGEKKPASSMWAVDVRAKPSRQTCRNLQRMKAMCGISEAFLPVRASNTHTSVSAMRSLLIGAITSTPPSVSTLMLNCSRRPKAISTWFGVWDWGFRRLGADVELQTEANPYVIQGLGFSAWAFSVWCLETLQ